MNLKISLTLSTVSKNSPEYASKKGDILSFSVISTWDPNTDSYDMGLYVDLTHIGGKAFDIADKIKITQLGKFTEYMEQFASLVGTGQEDGPSAAINPMQ